MDMVTTKKQNNWQHRGKLIWTAVLWKDITAWVENMVVEICYLDARVPKGHNIEEQQNNQQVYWAARIVLDQHNFSFEFSCEI